MLAHRVIPTLLTRGRTLVKGERFNAWRSVGVTAQAVRIFQARGCDELILLDIAATREARGPDLELVRELAEVCFMPLTVGGGVRSVENARALLRAGADKVAVGAAAVSDSRTLRTLSETFGSQAIVVSLNVFSGAVSTPSGHDYPSCGEDPARWAKRLAELGAGEILLTAIDREGTMSGYDLDLIRSVSEAVDIPVIAHGGCSGPQDMLAAIKAGASACAAGALFQFTDITPRECGRFLAENGVEARV